MAPVLPVGPVFPKEDPFTDAIEENNSKLEYATLLEIVEPIRVE